ncbi:MAG: hypothetical protein ABII71_03995 [Candidatus Micrarchaeota archaeon]
MGKGSGKINKKSAFAGNESLAMGALFALGLFACPRPMCLGTAAALLLNGMRQKAMVILWK